LETPSAEWEANEWPKYYHACPQYDVAAFARRQIVEYSLIMNTLGLTPTYDQVSEELVRLLNLLDNISVECCEERYQSAAAACRELLKARTLAEHSRSQITIALQTTATDCLAKQFALRQGVTQAFLYDYS